MTAPVRGFVSDQDIDNVIADSLRLIAEQRAERGRIRRMLDRMRPVGEFTEHLDEVDG
jgi:hypothetical protein